MEVASRAVVEARAADQEPPSSLWVFLEAGGRDLERLLDQVDGCPHPWTEAPPGGTIADSGKVVPAPEFLHSSTRRFPDHTASVFLGHRPIYGQPAIVG